MTVRRILVLDVDGVVSPIPGPTAWGDDVVSGHLFGPTITSPRMCNRLDWLVSLSPILQGMWLTDWSPRMRAEMNPLPGRDWPAVADPVVGFDRGREWAGDRWQSCTWWKWWALHEWISTHPEIERVVWVDDHLRPQRLANFDIDFRAEFEDLGVESVLRAPDTATGLTPEQFDEIHGTLL